MTKRIAILALLTSTFALAGATGASARPAPAPSVKIGSTRGAGPSGCVQSAKRVGFTLDGGSSSIWTTGATVLLDGKAIAKKTWTVGVALVQQARQKEAFTVRVNLAHKRAGRHTLKLTGTFLQVFTRKSGTAHAAAPASLTGSASKRITKCAAFTG